MTRALCIAALLIGTMSATVNAQEGQISDEALQAMGLSSLERMTDEEGTSVRGMSGSAMTMGMTLISGLILDPSTKSFVFGADANTSGATAENAGKQVVTMASSAQTSAVNLNLDILTNVSSFKGILIGGAGGQAAARSQ